METTLQSVEERIARLERYVTKVEEAQAEMVRAINAGEMEAFSEEDVRFHLSHDPNAIAEAGLFLAKIHRAYEYAKNDTKTIRAQVRREANSRRDELKLTSASDRDDYVQVDKRYQDALKQEFEWKYRAEQMEVIYERYQNLFAGSRKIANLIEKDNQNNYRIERYG